MSKPLKTVREPLVVSSGSSKVDAICMHPTLSVLMRVARRSDEARIIDMMRALIFELGPHEHLQSLVSRMDGDIRQALFNKDVRFILAHREQAVVGLIRADILRNDPIFRLRPDNRCGYIDQMYVEPAERGCGIGQKLLMTAEQWFAEAGIRHVMLHAAPRAARLYARLGYQPNRQMFKSLT